MNAPTETTPESPRRIRSVPLVFGTLFVILGYGGVVASADVDDAGIWLWPAALLVVGLAGLYATIRTGLSRRAQRADRSRALVPTATAAAGAATGDITAVIGETPGTDEPEDADEPGDERD